MARSVRLGIVLGMLVNGCVVPMSPATLPANDRAFVAALSGEMPAPIDKVSRHSWIVTHHARSRRFRRFEMGGDSETDPFQDFASGDVMLHGVIEMTDAELAQTEQCLAREQSRYHVDHPDYLAIPGPNSNTLVAYLLRHCSLRIELPSTAIGRDYVGVVGAQVTEAGTGVQVGTFPLGLRLGLREGVEAQLFGLPFGVHFWPPGITVPINPGRLGLESDGHVQRPRTTWHDDSEEARTPDRGVGSVTMFTRALGTVHPARAGGLQGMATVGMSARGLYGGRFGYGIGLDFEAGASLPAGFAGGVHLFPVGLGYAVSPTGFVGVFSGIGTSGVTGAVPAGLELPQELRVEFDVARRARLVFLLQGSFVAGPASRRQGRLWFDETRFGVHARFGDLVIQRPTVFASGMFFGLERREVMDSAMVGLVLGTEIDAGLQVVR